MKMFEESEYFPRSLKNLKIFEKYMKNVKILEKKIIFFF
jgi:hypothetical protein